MTMCPQSKVNPLTMSKYNLNYAFPTRCVKE